jgi:hypothetical protein
MYTNSKIVLEAAEGLPVLRASLDAWRFDCGDE